MGVVVFELRETADKKIQKNLGQLPFTPRLLAKHLSRAATNDWLTTPLPPGLSHRSDSCPPFLSRLQLILVTHAFCLYLPLSLPVLTVRVGQQACTPRLLRLPARVHTHGTTIFNDHSSVATPLTHKPEFRCPFRISTSFGRGVSTVGTIPVKTDVKLDHRVSTTWDLQTGKLSTKVTRRKACDIRVPFYPGGLCLTCRVSCCLSSPITGLRVLSCGQSLLGDSTCTR